MWNHPKCRRTLDKYAVGVLSFDLLLVLCLSCLETQSTKSCRFSTCGKVYLFMPRFSLLPTALLKRNKRNERLPSTTRLIPTKHPCFALPGSTKLCHWSCKILVVAHHYRGWGIREMGQRAFLFGRGKFDADELSVAPTFCRGMHQCGAFVVSRCVPYGIHPKGCDGRGQMRFRKCRMGHDEPRRVPIRTIFCKAIGKLNIRVRHAPVKK